MTELKRRWIFMGFAAVAVALALYALVLSFGHFMLVLAAAIGLLAVGAYVQYSGKTGFYELSESGELGKFYGRRPPAFPGPRQRLK